MFQSFQKFFKISSSEISHISSHFVTTSPPWFFTGLLPWLSTSGPWIRSCPGMTYTSHHNQCIHFKGKAINSSVLHCPPHSFCNKEQTVCSDRQSWPELTTIQPHWIALSPQTHCTCSLQGLHGDPCPWPGVLFPQVSVEQVLLKGFLRALSHGQPLNSFLNMASFPTTSFWSTSSCYLASRELVTIWIYLFCLFLSLFFINPDPVSICFKKN